MSRAPMYIGTAGWAIPPGNARDFPGLGSHLERYARVLWATEINTSFYRNPKPETYQRWAASVPAHFRFAVKLSREITHFRRLANVARPLREFCAGAKRLGRKLGPILVQLPPSLAFDARRADAFFRSVRQLHRGPVVCEPRHASWFEPAAERLLIRHRVARVAAHPAPLPLGTDPAGWPRLVYYRLHGAPRMYSSAYTDDFLAGLAAAVRSHAKRAHVWCIFDNTAAGAATGDALTLSAQVADAR